MKVIKRDGTPQEYDFDKIVNAVTKAYSETEEPVPQKFLDQLKESVEKLLSKYEDGTPIEEIQDCIQRELIKRNKYDVVEAFITYRKKHEEIREQKSALTKQIKAKLSGKNIVNQNANIDEESFGGRIGEAASEVCKDDALKNCMSKKSRKNHEQNMIYQHDLNSFSVGMHNCLSVPIDPLLEHGFTTKQCDVRPASSLNTAFQLVAVNFQIQSLQQFGGVACTHLDWTMVPYFRRSFYKHYVDWCEGIPGCTHVKPNIDKDDVKYISIEDNIYKGKHNPVKHLIWERAYRSTIKELHQACEGLFHNLNTLQSRSGNQLPFSSINYGTCTLPEGRAVIGALLDTTIAGTGKYHRTSIFPCVIFQYDKDIHGTKDKPGPNYDMFRKALSATVRRDYPNYANCNWTVNLAGNKYDREQKQIALDNITTTTYAKLHKWLTGHKDYQEFLSLEPIYRANLPIITVKPAECFSRYEMMSTMGCRTYNGYDINCDAEYFKKLFEHIAETGNVEDNWLLSANQKDGRGNICPVTIIMPTLAMMAKNKGGDIVEAFMKLLEQKIYEAKDMLLERFNIICSQPASAAKYMYENNTMVGYISSEGIISALKHGTLVIGQLGLAETLQILIGCDQTTEEGLQLGIRIEKLFNALCKKFKEELKLNFGVYLTPAENLCYTAMKKFKAAYGIIPNVSDKEWFTNSTHVSVTADVDAFTKVDIESKLDVYSNAGCITYVEMPSTCINNLDACEKLIVHAMNIDLPYVAINYPLDSCRDCHAQGDFNGVCPECGSTNIEELRRVTGYLSTDKKNFNKGKIAETNHRVQHVGKEVDI